MPCHATELVKCRNRIGPDGVREIFALSVQLHGKATEDKTVLVDTTVQEKAITYPTDSKLAIKVINRLNKLAKADVCKGSQDKQQSTSWQANGGREQPLMAHYALLRNTMKALNPSI